MTNGLIVDASALLDLSHKNPYVAYVIRQALQGHITVWIPSYCFATLVGHDDSLAALIEGMTHMVPGQIIIGPRHPAYIRAMRNYGRLFSSIDQAAMVAAYDALAHGWPVLTGQPHLYTCYQRATITYER